MIPLRAEILEGIIVDVAGIVGSVIFPIVVMGKGTTLLVEQSGVQAAEQLRPDKCPQVCAVGAGFDLFDHFAMLRKEVLAHQVMFHAPAQVDGHVVVGIDGVNVQFLLLDTLQVIGGIVHADAFIHILHIAKSSSGNSVLAGGVYDKTDTRHLVPQSVFIMRQFIVQFILVKRNDLIKVNLLAARQGADRAAFLCILGFNQDSSTQFGVFCKGFTVLHGMSVAQPAVTVDGQAGQGFQQTDGPVPLFVLHGFLIQLPVRRQGDGQLRPLQLVFGQFLRHIHPVGTHAHGYQGVVVPIPRGRHNADVHMDVRGRQLVEHILKLAEILLNVSLDGLHLLLGVDLGNTVFFILGHFTVRVIVIIVRVTVR